MMHATSPFAAPQQQQRRQHQSGAAGSASPPASSSSVGTALGGGGAGMHSSGAQSSSPAASNAQPAAPQQQLQQQQQGHHHHHHHGNNSFNPSREWLYRLVTFPSYFTPCPACCGGARTPKREQLMTQFDTQFPYRVYCSNCPECKARLGSGALLQVRRSAFKDVVKASDLARYGADTAGVQQYTLNGSKVIYLNREQAPEKKGASNTNAAPAACSVDGRAMMDKSSTYCSLKCKMIAEELGFTEWLDGQDPSVRILAQAAANAPPRPTLASKRAAPSPTSSGSSDECGHATSGSGSGGGAHAAGSGVTSGASSGASRPPKCARTLSASLAAGASPAAQHHQHQHQHHQQQQQQHGGQHGDQQLQRAATTPAAMPAPPPAGLRRIRISLSSASRRGAPAPGAADLQAAGLPAAPHQHPGPQPGGNWLDLDSVLSCSATWDTWGSIADGGGLDSPCFTAAGPTQQQGQGKQQAGAALRWGEEGTDGEDGSMSPALIHAPSAFAASDCDDWWLSGSPLGGTFSCPAGMGALLSPPGGLPEAAPCGLMALPARGGGGVPAPLLARTASASTDGEATEAMPGLTQCC